MLNGQLLAQWVDNPLNNSNLFDQSNAKSFLTKPARLARSKLFMNPMTTASSYLNVVQDQGWRAGKEKKPQKKKRVILWKI